MPQPRLPIPELVVPRAFAAAVLAGAALLGACGGPSDDPGPADAPPPLVVPAWEEVLAGVVARADVDPAPVDFALTRRQEAALARARELLQLYALDPRRDEVLLQAADVFGQWMYPGRALGIVGEYLARHEPSSDALGRAAQYLLDEQGPAPAIALARRSLELTENHARSVGVLAEALLRLERGAEAIAVCEEAIAAMPARADLRKIAGRAHLESGDAERALAHLERAAPLLADDLELLFLLARAYRELGREDEAAETAARHERLSRIADLGMPPNTPPERVQLELASRDLESGRPERAARELEELLARQWIPGAVDLLRRALEESGADVGRELARLEETHVHLRGRLVP